MARVLVTGANGKAGGYVVSALIAQGHDVRAVYRSKPGRHPGVDWRQADVTRPETLSGPLEGCAAVIHLAAELREQSLMESTNVEATKRLVALSRAGGIRYFGHASSIVIYGSPRHRFVNEETPRIDPLAPMSKQYYAEPYMLDYARTKAAGEIAIEAMKPGMTVHFYRPGVVVADEDLLNFGQWSRMRKIFAAYRRTQFITAVDAAAAIVHLMQRGLATAGEPGGSIEAYNIVEEEVDSYRSLFALAYAATHDGRFRLPMDVPVVLDMAKDFVRHRTLQLRYPLGMIHFSGAKLRSSGFVPRLGVSKAIGVAIAGLRHGARAAPQQGLQIPG